MRRVDDFAMRFAGICPGFKGWLLSLTAFFDDADVHESGVKTQSIVAGILFELEGAQEFAKGLARICPDLERPFHATTCANGRLEFRDWGKERCNRVLDEVAQLIADTRGPAAFVSAITLADFEAFCAQNPKSRNFVANPFTLNLLNCLGMIGNWTAREQRPDEIEYVFEAGSTGEKDAADFIRRLYQIPRLRERHRIHGYAFQPKAHASALIAADFLAWESQRNAKLETGWTERMMVMAKDSSKPLYVHPLDQTSISHWSVNNWFFQLHEEADPPEDYLDEV
jgi:hypothetical protein